MSKVYRGLAALAAVAAMSACGSSSSGPFLASEVPGAGATIRGTVVDGAVAGATGNAVRAFSHTSGVRVTVLGAGIATTTDASGGFVLEGVPAGTVTLEFESDGARARLEIRGLLPGQELGITVSLSGSDATLVDVEGEEVEVRGTVESLDPLRVAGVSFEVTEDTRVLRRGEEIPFDQIEVGDLVEVDGVRLPDGSVLALRVRLEDADDDDPGDDDSDDDSDEDSDEDSDDDSDQDSDQDSDADSDSDGSSGSGS